MNHRVNRIFIDSIPLNRKVKRYWTKKYERIALNCGRSEADRKFKQLKLALTSYLSDNDRLSNLAMYLGAAGFRNNGMLRQLFEYAETQPHFVLNLLKLYSYGGKPTKSVDTAARETVKRMEEVKACSAIPKYLSSWLDICLSKGRRKQWKSARSDPRDPFHALAKHHSLSEWSSYWGKWYGILRRGWTSPVKESIKKTVFPEVYKDFQEDNKYSRSYNKDFGDLVSLHQNFDGPLSGDELDFVGSFLDEDVHVYLNQILWGENPVDYVEIFKESNINSGYTVGEVQHIHKKGSGSDYRDIAVPNRFIQLALAPGAERLYHLVRALPQDATFDQRRFDTKIQNRVNNESLYQGSVDLSKATDNLPLSWGMFVISSLRSAFDPSSSEERLIASTIPRGNESLLEQVDKQNRSLDLFQTVSRSPWEDQGYWVKWEVGQPLGSLPSFAVLAITHNLILESMSASLGLAHSPYCILGDDLVVFNKKLRSQYIRDLTSRAIPLSLHKSFDGRLSEFAGKTYIRNNVPFHTPDQTLVTFESLFDWQRSSGIRIPWENLPGNIRKRLTEVVRSTGLAAVPTKHGVVQSAKMCYELILTCEVPGRGSHIYPFRDSDSLSERMIGYFMNRISDDSVPTPVPYTGISLMANRFPITLMGTQFADKNGYFQSYRPVALPEWYKVKFRPSTTEAMMRASAEATLKTI